MRRTLLGLYTYLEFGLCLLAWFPILGFVRLVDADNLPRRGRWMRRFGRTTSRLTPLWKFSVEGKTPSDITRRPYVVVANHESVADPFLVSHLPWDMRWVGKEELFRMPIIGSMLHWGGDIPLRRGDGESVRAMFAEARVTLARGLSMMLFPEGTRSADGSLGPFKDGAFRLAIEAGVPILPLAIEGTRACRPKGSRWFGDAKARVRVLEPIATAGLAPADAARLAATAHERIAAALADMRGQDRPTRAASAPDLAVRLAS